MIRFCSTCKKKHDIDDWYPIMTYGIREPSAYHCKKFLEIRPEQKLRATTEHIPDSMKEDRRANEKSMIQPWREGEVSAEYIKAYPEQAKKMFTEKERMRAKDVWKDTLHTNWEKSQ